MDNKPVNDRVAAQREFGLVIMTIPLLVFMPVLLLLGVIGVEEFLAVSGLQLIISLVLILGPENISEVSLGSASIRRNVRASQEVLADVEAIRDQLRDVAKASVVNTYILSSTSEELRNSPNTEPAKRLSKNMDRIWAFAYPDPKVAYEAMQDARELFGHQRNTSEP